MNVPMNNSQLTLSLLDSDRQYYSCKMEPVIATCCISGLSEVQYTCNCLCRMKANFPSPSSQGLDWSASLKACDTFFKAALTDSDLLDLCVFQNEVYPLGWRGRQLGGSCVFCHERNCRGTNVM